MLSYGALKKRLRKLGYPPPPELPVVVLVAVNPGLLQRDDFSPEREAFVQCLARDPDAVIEVMRFVRGRI